MKIIYHHRTQAGDAQGIHIREIIRCLRRNGHEVLEIALVKCDQPVQPSGNRESRLGFLRSLLPDVLGELMELLYIPVGYIKLIRAIKGFRPDFIYERYALYNAAGVLASRRYNIPLILEVNAPLAIEQANEGKLTFHKLARRFESWICCNSARTLCVSTPLKQILVGMGVPNDHVEVMPNGVDPDQFHGRDSGAQVRLQYGLKGSRVIGFAGWLRSWHGLTELVASMADWPVEMEDVHVLIVGDGPARPDIEAAAARANVAARVHITGPVGREEIVDYIAAMDVALQPAATSYASPMKIFEYLAMGKPVIAPRQGNITEILSDGDNAVFFSPGRPEELIKAVQSLLAEPGKALAMGENARQTIFDRGYLWSRNAERTVEMASLLISNRC